MALGVLVLLGLSPDVSSEPPGPEPMVVEEITHAHTKIDAQSGGCVGTYNVHVSAKTAGAEYGWYTYVNGVGSNNNYQTAPLWEGPGQQVFELEDGETLSLSAGIWNVVAPNADSSYDTASVTCDEP